MAAADASARGQRAAILASPLFELTGFNLTVDCLSPGCARERTFAVTDLASFYGSRTVGEVLRRMRYSMQRKITGFHLDEEGHWVAELECGHNQHVRHDPPYVERPWVITEHGRRSRLGQELNCVRCDEDRCAMTGGAG